MTANITNARRRAVYQRDHYRCVLCDSTDGIQVHHYVPRGCGGHHSMHNLVTLCWRCHGTAHGVEIYPHFNENDVAEGVAEYLVDIYGNDWNPYQEGS